MKYPSHDLRNLKLCNDSYYIILQHQKKKTISRAILSLFKEIDYKNYRNSKTSFSFKILFIMWLKDLPTRTNMISIKKAFTFSIIYQLTF